MFNGYPLLQVRVVAAGARPLGRAGAVRRVGVPVCARAAAGRPRGRLLRLRPQGLHRRPRRRAGRRVHRAGEEEGSEETSSTIHPFQASTFTIRIL